MTAFVVYPPCGKVRFHGHIPGTVGTQAQRCIDNFHFSRVK